MLNIVIPMAGEGSRFANAGYELPKPIIPVHKLPMIQLVVNNVRPHREHRFIFIVQRSHLRHYNVESVLRCATHECEIIPIDGMTEGAACTVLLAKPSIDPSSPMMIVNSDQYIACDINSYLDSIDDSDWDGAIMTMESDHPKWSYARVANEGLVQEVAEKQVISNHATVGIYNVNRSSEFFSAAEEMISQNLRVRGEFYVAPVFNQLILRRKRIGVWSFGSEKDGMYGLGTPEDLEYFQKLPISREAESKYWERMHDNP